jgi:hypothetical protein
VARLDDDRRRVRRDGAADHDRMGPGRQRVQQRDPAVRCGMACRPGRLPEDVVRRQDDVQQLCLNFRNPHGPAVEGDGMGLPRTVVTWRTNCRPPMGSPTASG